MDTPSKLDRGIATETAVLSYLQGLLRQGGIDHEGRLPTERQLADQLGANRATVRKVLTRLELEGQILRQVGRGTFVAGSPADAEGEHDEYSPVAILDVRLMLEPRAIAIACVSATRRDLQEISDCHEKSLGVTDHEAFELWDGAFHFAIGRAVHNPLLIRFYELLDSSRRGEQWGTLKRRSFSNERRVEYQAQHAAILAALTERDSNGAEQAMSLHIRTVKSHLLNQ
jgi:DNA-binding FadR family transcriptional regulator